MEKLRGRSTVKCELSELKRTRNVWNVINVLMPHFLTLFPPFHVLGTYKIVLPLMIEHGIKLNLTCSV
jgi:hypothetical protein